MNQLGQANLFTSHFVMGCIESIKEFTKTETDEIKYLHQWLDYKDTDWGMRKYQSNRTQYVDFINFIPINDFKQIVFDLYVIHKKNRPFAGVSDFIENCFSYTIRESKLYIERDFTWLGSLPSQTHYTCYYYFEWSSKEFIDVVISDDYDIEDVKQYFKRVLDVLENFEEVILNKRTQSIDKRECPKLTLKEIALLYVFNDEVIDTSNADKIAQIYKHKSGQKLTYHFNNYRRASNRTNIDPEQKRSINSLIKNYIKVIPLIDNADMKALANKELTQFYDLLN